MKFIQNPWEFIRRLSPFYFLLLLLSPFLLSLMLHVITLMLFTYITWNFPALKTPAERNPASTILHGKTEDRLRFQGMDRLDKFKVRDKMVYPLPEVEYRPVLPGVKLYPEPRVREEFDLISVEVETMNQEWVNPSTGRQPFYTGPEKLVGSFTRHIQILREGGLDVVFVFDSTYSMAGFLKKVKLKITNLAAAFKKLVPTSRIGLVTYRDVGDDFVTKVHQLTYGTKSLQNFLQTIDPKGGGDRKEAVDEGLRVAIEELDWKEKSKKIILLIGDAPPHRKDITKTITLIKKFREKMAGTVTALDVSFYHSIEPVSDRNVSEGEAMEEFKLFADVGGGESAHLIDEKKVIRQMLMLVFGTRWEVFLDEFLKNL